MKETDGIDYLEGYKKGKQEGLREVVEWIETFEQNQYYIFVMQESLQAKLKEWRIE